MRYSEVEKILADAVEALVSVGVSRTAANKAMQDAEVVAVMDLIETQADRRFIDLFETMGSATLAERKGVSPRTICTYRKEALDRLSRKQIGSGASANTSGIAA